MERKRKIYGKNMKKWIIFLLAILTGMAYAQRFGKNKVQYQDFDWKFIRSKHFDTYYYNDNITLAEFAIDVAESSYVALQKDIHYEIEKRIPIIVYASHNDFEQTNASYTLLEESVEGFTEPLKDRVVVQYRGSYNDFKKLIHHELTHAVMIQMMYGRSIGGAVTAMATLQIPLWVWEGMAEYESVGWDSESDMFVRDATINNYIPPIDYLMAYWAYKGGQSVFNYIAETYGSDKIGEILSKIKTHRGFEPGLKKAVGIGTKELTKRWHKYLQKNYWPDIKDRDEPGDVAKKLTDHTKEKNTLNNSPSLSPQGDKLVYLSNRLDYMDIHMLNVLDGKNMGRLVQGERSDLFEELHWPRPGIGWSPDGGKIVFAAKAQGQDALYLYDVKKKSVIETHILEMDGIFSPNWSPDSDRIVFMGMKNGQTDLYVFNLKDETYKNITNDEFDDLDPIWSPSGEEIAFVSDRRNGIDPKSDKNRLQMFKERQVDLYTIDVQTGEITRHTEDYFEEKSPAFSPDGNKIAYLTDKNGISNIHIYDRPEKTSYPITNLITGVSQFSWSREGSRLAFASFYDAGFDIYLINNPLDIEPGSIELKDTAWLENQKKGKKYAVKKEKPEPAIEKHASGRQDFQNYVFGSDFKKGDIKRPESQKSILLDEEEYKSGKEYTSKEYKVKFTPDFISGGAGYSQFYGLQGSSMIVLSDILGNHQINIYTDIFYNIKNSNLQLAYYYLPKRTDLGIAFFHYSYPYYTYFQKGEYWYWGYIRDRNYGFALSLSRPFSKYKRFDIGLTGLAIDRDLVEIDLWGYSNEFLQEQGNLYRKRVMLLNLGYTTDTVLWGWTGPMNGSRSNLTFTYSPSISKNYGLDFWTLKGDWRKYYRVARNFAFALRFSAGISGGKQPQQFFIGGMPNWINYKYRQIYTDIWEADNFYFSTLENPLRGTVYYDMVGSRFMLANLEFRFPLVQYLLLGFPLPFGFQNIRGVLFLDVGSAWSNDKAWKPFTENSLGLAKFNDLTGGIGFGARLNIGFFLLKYDLAWPTNLDVITGDPIHYFTLGAEF